MCLGEHRSLACWNREASAARDWSINALEVKDNLKRFYEVIGQYFTVQILLLSTWIQMGCWILQVLAHKSSFVQVSRLTKQQECPWGAWDQMTLTAGMWWHQMLVALSCLLVLQGVSAAVQQWLWRGRLEVWVCSCSLGHFSDQVSSLAGEKCWGTGTCSTGASRKEISWTTFPSREIYHATTSWALTPSTGGFFSLPHPLLLPVQAVWMPSSDQGHYGDFLWHLILMTPG